MVVVMRIGRNNLKPRSESLGFTYIGLMIMVAISGIALAGVGIVWHQDVQREREKELLFIGNAYRLAIGSYFESSPSGAKQYPRKLEDLILDNRFPNIKRHLRKLYSDPVTRDLEWGLVLEQQQIIGIFSKSSLIPIKQKEFTSQYANFNDAKEYSDWKFIHTPGML